MNDCKVGRIVWHDLFTTGMDVSKSFYRRVAGWHFVTEHATDFSWGGGEQDYVLALAGDEAGAGLVEAPWQHVDNWVPYVEVGNVDAIANLADELGGVLVRAPFEVPGVGRNCLLRDPLGALVGVCLSRHSFPKPERQFGVECYLTQSKKFPAAFYNRLFGWDTLPADCGQGIIQEFTVSSDKVGISLVNEAQCEIPALWVPGIKVGALSDVLLVVRDLDGSVHYAPPLASNERSMAVVLDPNGAFSCLVEAPLP